MADFRADRRYPGASGSSLVLGVMGGAVLGAVGLGWWLLSEAERRRRQRPFQPALSSEGTRLQPADGIIHLPQRLRSQRNDPGEPALQERVQQLNQAIDEVRRQLEALQPLP